jgi:NAD(P)-dependent dehydrogenase (short-subunit alcohol dehydrogenase family)
MFEIYRETRIVPWTCKIDITDEKQVKKMIDQTVQTCGQIDILINNAGIFKDAVSWKMYKETWDSVLATNLTGAFLCTKHVLPIMRERKFGRIVNVSSIVGQTGVFGASNYAASKAGLIGFTKAIAKEVALKGITVNCVALGYIEAGMNLRLSEQLRNQIRDTIPMKRFGTPEEVSEVILFLCSKEASYITGQVIGINGGLI